MLVPLRYRPLPGKCRSVAEFKCELNRINNKIARRRKAAKAAKAARRIQRARR